ncbi:MAG: hypothetical protein M3259_03855 [Actinomycetota bacterium]|jgi:hypothetical protein|nr:hypothetical protein [Actinomycetota bacterium]
MTEERYGVVISGASKIGMLNAENIVKFVPGLELEALADPTPRQRSQRLETARA